MGKKQHSKDRMYITATEWKNDFGGHKGTAAVGDYARLPLDCCSLSFQPFTHPVCTVHGNVFDLENIVPYVQRHHRDPITLAPLELSGLIKLHFDRTDDGQDELRCPILFKQFTANTHVIAIRTTGNVYSYDAIDQLCFKTKSMRDLLDDTPFTKGDIITLQDPHQLLLSRNMSAFAHMNDADVAKQVEAIRKAASGGKSSSASAEAMAAMTASASSSSSKASSSSSSTLSTRVAVSKPVAPTPAAPTSSGPARAMYSSGSVSSSFTSTAASVATNNERSLLSADQIQTQHYAHLHKVKSKGYVRLHTTLGHINLELAVDLAPRTCHNFLELCERNYYKDCIIHRVIPGFMMQGGDPSGSGRGGAGAFQSTFPDEFHSALSHDRRGVLAMANSGPNTNASQFYITFDAARHLDMKHTVFGRVVGGGEVLDAIEKVEVSKGGKSATAKPKDAPIKDIVITATTVFTNPYKDAFVPVDELTRKKENHVDEVEEPVEMGSWFSAMPSSSSSSSSAPGSSFKYLNMPSTTSTTTASTTTSSTSTTTKRKEMTTTATTPAVDQHMHPVKRAALAAASSSSSTPSRAPIIASSSLPASSHPPSAPSSSSSSSSSSSATDVAAFDRLRRQQQQAMAARAAASAPKKSGGFDNW